MKYKKVKVKIESEEIFMSSPLLKENQNITGSGRNHGIDLLRLVYVYGMHAAYAWTNGILMPVLKELMHIEHIGFGNSVLLRR